MCPAGSPVVLIIVPAYNAGKYLSELILRIKNSAPKSDILVVDDGSTDETSDILKSSNVIVLVNSSNKGKGYSLQRGFDYAIENNYDYVITLDADLQHLPEEIPLLMDKIGTADIVIGTRDVSLKTMPLTRWISNSLTSMIISKFCGYRIRDSQSGFRMYSVGLLRKLNVKLLKYDFESELLIQAGKLNARFAEIPVTTIYQGSSSHIKRLADTGRFIRLIWRRIVS